MYKSDITLFLEVKTGGKFSPKQFKIISRRCFGIKYYYFKVIYSMFKDILNRIEFEKINTFDFSLILKVK